VPERKVRFLVEGWVDAPEAEKPNDSIGKIFVQQLIVFQNTAAILF